MAEPKTITVYKEGRDPIQISPDAWPEAQQKGWSNTKTQPKQEAQPQAQPQAAPPQSQNRTPGAQHQGLMKSFGQGVNPFHATPQGTPPMYPNDGSGTKMIDDMVNAREIKDKWKSGNKGEATAMAGGTALSFAGPELVKGVGTGIKGASELLRGAKEVPMLSKAAQRATSFAKELRISPEVARYVERTVQPLHDALDKKWEPVHQALEKSIIQGNRAITRFINRMETSEMPAIAKLAEELKGRTAFDYREAEGLRRKLLEMGGKEAEQWKPILDGFAKELDDVIQKEANHIGVGKMREELRATYKEIRDGARAAAHTAKTKQGILRGSAAAGADIAGQSGVGAIIRSGTETVLRLEPAVKARLTKLAEKLGVDAKLLEQGVSTGEKVGTGIERTGKVARGTNVGGRAMPQAIKQMAPDFERAQAVPSH